MTGGRWIRGMPHSLHSLRLEPFFVQHATHSHNSSVASGGIWHLYLPLTSNQARLKRPHKNTYSSQRHHPRIRWSRSRRKRRRKNHENPETLGSPRGSSPLARRGRFRGNPAAVVLVTGSRPRGKYDDDKPGSGGVHGAPCQGSARRGLGSARTHWGASVHGVNSRRGAMRESRHT